jgi:RNA polymerase II subunit A small phosphatase-like protein
MSITPPEPTTGPTGSTNPTIMSDGAKPQPKKKGFLSFLCCGVPDSPTTLDPGESTTILANKITKVPSGRPTTASRPDPAVVNQQNITQKQPETEKEALLQESQPKPEPIQERKEVVNPEPVNPEAVKPLSAPNGELSHPVGDARDQQLPDLPREEIDAPGPSNPAVVVQTSSKSESADTEEVPEAPKDAEGDVNMDNSEAVPEETEEAPVARREETVNKQVLPPPPPVPQQPPNSNEGAIAPPEPAEQKQQWLLPPITPRFQGKKCLVLDLDETLVHSSFKVCSCNSPNTIR